VAGAGVLVQDRELARPLVLAVGTDFQLAGAG